MRSASVSLLLPLVVALASCSGSAEKPTLASKTGRAEINISIVGTNDLHGHIEMLPLLGGYLKVLRQEHDVVLLDGGDMFQGTLESNLREGAPIVEAYNLLGYAAVTIGNHEFDFGPVGEDATVSRPEQDPRGALKARAAQADFPFLAANVFAQDTQAAVSWPNVRPTTIITAAGVQVGIIGVTTFETPQVTLPANFLGLVMAPLAEVIAFHAKSLRAQGAKVVVVAAHAGGSCSDFGDSHDLSSCKPDAEIFDVAQALPLGSVDVIVAGHTHRGLAHTVNGIAIIESYARGVAFGRVDLRVGKGGKVEIVELHSPQLLCSEGKGPDCKVADYEGKPVQSDAEIRVVALQAEKNAEATRARQLGTEILSPLLRSRSEASALGNLFVDLMLAAMPTADVAINNGGSLRADIPAGPLRYGDLFEAMPFDNHFALVTLRGETLRKLLAENLTSEHGILSIAGMRATAECVAGQLVVKLRRDDGSEIKDQDLLKLATSDFLASGGDGLLGSEGLKPEKIELDGGPLIRDAMAARLSSIAKIELTAALFDPKNLRIKLPGPRPLRCD